MAQYTIAILAAGNLPGIIKLVRAFSTESVAAIARKIGTAQPVISLDTQDFSLEISEKDGITMQYNLLLTLIGALEHAGATVQIQLQLDDSMEVVSIEALHNLLESELTYLAQAHD
ncbi:hypothetical protein [Pseudomonas rubra]|uniref:ACT domain-containing protein n=1 Tax=Pseudomonas rubra TaxID=2942627 RepID=A0ABT5P1C3_9PSED|nr:hypothetical protein [Pseudomonas rubra]MDD1012076.1 hypothetical protein [Pseudomonas rubra]MDD1038488.1 hypothetical protein [Pseudomonas rubra]MDD1153525.1 hypothetical protein [Pseudomonas rubra]